MLAAAFTLATLLVALGLIRWLAPGLLGGPTDLQLVKSSKEVPPFFEGVFRAEDIKSADFLLKDPRTVNRPRPFAGEIPEFSVGPHDILGFRNRAVPAVADVVVLGDSQTYGLNVMLEDNWPSRMAAQLPGRSVYSMAIGGWGAVQYTDLFSDAAAFRPRVVVVAFYTGNDPLESFTVAYGSEQWRALRPDPGLRASDAPAVQFPPPKEDWWTATLGGTALTFAPKLRLFSNDGGKAAEGGYGVIRKAAQHMSQVAQASGFALLIAFIPTEERVYAPRIKAEQITPSADFATLVANEEKRVSELCAEFGKLPSTQCVDLAIPLQAAAMTRTDLYPAEMNGHPLEGGYRVMGEAMARMVAPLLPPAPESWVGVPGENGQPPAIFLVRDGVAWMFPGDASLKANGWAKVLARPVTRRDLDGIPKRFVTEVDPKRFGPR